MLEVTEIGLVVDFETFLIRGSLPISSCSAEDELVPKIEVFIVLVYTVIVPVVDANDFDFKGKVVVNDQYKK
jgi:hypothetical protein